MGKVVIITGATGGLGSEIAKKFGRTGAYVVLSDLPNVQNEMDKLANEINKGPGQSFTYQVDVRHYEELKRMAEETIKRWGRIDTVINTAGGTLAMLTKGENKSLLEHSEEEWDFVLDVNLKGSFNSLRAVAPQMVKQGDGHIILIASGSGIKPGKLMSSYAAAKAGVFGLMKAAAREFGEYNIKVNAINPGLIMHKQMTLGGLSSEAYINDTMLLRLSHPEEVADFIVYLSQRNNISGQIFNLDSKVLF
jgi:3-oxoacyl-[acyl-carrier protein] reductase